MQDERIVRGREWIKKPICIYGFPVNGHICAKVNRLDAKRLAGDLYSFFLGNVLLEGLE